MKMTSLNFLESYIKDEYILNRIRDHIFDAGHTGHTPRKWKKDLLPVPSKLLKTSNVDATIWVLIRYEGAVELTLVENDDLITQTPVGIQRAICIDLTEGKKVGWRLYQNSVSDVQHKDVKENIRTYKIV